MLTASGFTHPGRVRSINEDAFLCDPELGVFVVADGMGGHNAGEVASELAVESVRSFLARTQGGEAVTWPYGIDPVLSFDANRLLTAIRLANRRVFKAGESREEYTGMGTTIVAAMIADGRLVFSSVGDSRLYALRGGALTQVTQDDTWVAMMMSQGRFDPDTIARHPMKHVLTNVVGAREQIDCDVCERELGPCETLLLSTDGLHSALEHDRIAALLRTDLPAGQVARRLVDEALERDGADNLTAVVVRYER